ncbi:MAG: iron dicitrate transport regulator FecR [Proteobacteria bacterium]|nr:MAG: iron dicitrate transport regulator FecR [Pseudomonadota bacterium]
MGRRPPRGGRWGGGGGAFLGVPPPLQLWPDWSSLTADLRTGIGEQRQIVLGAVVVDLNTRTSINVRRADTGEVAALELVTGEAQVRLPSGLPLPFVVTAGAGEVTASGAARFNVRATGPSVCVTCLEGAIELRRADRILVARAAQQITYSGSQEALMTVADPAIVTAWRERMLIFNDEPLTAVVDEINRYRPGRIIVTNAELGRRRVQAQVRLDQLAEVVELIRVGYGAKVTTLPAGIVLLS